MLRSGLNSSSGEAKPSFSSPAMAAPVRGMTCISPRASAALATSGRKALSRRMMAHTR